MSRVTFIYTIPVFFRSRCYVILL